MAKETPKKETSNETVATEEQKAPAPQRDYSKYATQTAIPTQVVKRQFDTLKVSGQVERDAEDKRVPAKAVRTLMTAPKKGDRFEQVDVALPLTIVPIKYRCYLEEKAKDDKGTVLKFSSEYNGNRTDTVIIGTKTASGKTEFSKPMTVNEARTTFVDSEGKSLLREVVRVYALHNEDLVRFRVHGSGIWESNDIKDGKTKDSQEKHDTISQYLSKFAENDPYFLYEMEVGAVYRDHKSAVKYYRPTFKKGKRIDAATEDRILGAVDGSTVGILDDLTKYFADLDEETKKFIPTVADAEGGVADTTTHIDTDEGGDIEPVIDPATGKAF